MAIQGERNKLRADEQVGVGPNDVLYVGLAIIIAITLWSHWKEAHS